MQAGKRVTRSSRQLTWMAACLVAALAVGCSDASQQSSSTSSGGTKSSSSSASSASSKATALPRPTPATDPKALAEKGRSYYLSSCIACHNSDPAKDGALGPAVASSSWELLEARVMRAEYPAGYTPKRDTRVMVAMPFLERQLPALAAYLAP
jgi:mono/diheme cytochrome c family protein